MKSYLFALCLVVSLIGLNSCNKSSDPAPTSPVIGRWTLHRGLLSGFPTSAGVNGESLDLYYWESYASTVDIYSDNTFNADFKQGFVYDAPGTWEYSNNTLTLKYNTGDDETYTYTKTDNIEELALTSNINYTLPLSSTSTADGQVQLIYRK